LALGNYKMGKYREAKKFNETLLKLEENNPQALSLRTLINDKVQTGNLISE
jgi:fission 1 protein